MANSRDRSALIVLVCASLILFLSLGTRQGFGLFLQPITADLDWSRQTFAFAIALQNLVWGIAQPFAGAIADRRGAGRVVFCAGLLYASGLVAMAFAPSSSAFNLAAGVTVGLGLAGCGFGVVMGVAGRAVAPERLGLALGIVGAGGSLGQFLLLPYAAMLIASLGWQQALLALAASVVAISLLARGLVVNEVVNEVVKPSGESKLGRTATEVIDPSHMGRRTRRIAMACLTASLLVCGFQTTFIMVHLPAFLVDQGMRPRDGVVALAVVGLFNVIGSFLCGYLGDRFSKKRLLMMIYLVRAAVLALFVLLPLTLTTLYIFAAVMGFTWLGTVPLSNGLVAHLYGRRNLATLFSVTFLGHQIGAFLGVWSGGALFDWAGSYAGVWWLAIVLSLIAAAACLAIDERQRNAMLIAAPE